MLAFYDDAVHHQPLAPLNQALFANNTSIYTAIYPHDLLNNPIIHWLLVLIYIFTDTPFVIIVLNCWNQFVSFTGT